MISQQYSQARTAWNCELPVVAELNRVRQRAAARLGTGIPRRSVKKMVSKLDRRKSSGRDSPLKGMFHRTIGSESTGD